MSEKIAKILMGAILIIICIFMLVGFYGKFSLFSGNNIVIIIVNIAVSLALTFVNFSAIKGRKNFVPPVVFLVSLIAAIAFAGKHLADRMDVMILLNAVYLVTQISILTKDRYLIVTLIMIVVILFFGTIKKYNGFEFDPFLNALLGMIAIGMVFVTYKVEKEKDASDRYMRIGIYWFYLITTFSFFMMGFGAKILLAGNETSRFYIQLFYLLIQLLSTGIFSAHLAMSLKAKVRPAVRMLLGMAGSILIILPAVLLYQFFLNTESSVYIFQYETYMKTLGKTSGILITIQITLIIIQFAYLLFDMIKNRIKRPLIKGLLMALFLSAAAVVAYFVYVETPFYLLKSGNNLLVLKYSYGRGTLIEQDSHTRQFDDTVEVSFFHQPAFAGNDLIMISRDDDKIYAFDMNNDFKVRTLVKSTDTYGFMNPCNVRSKDDKLLFLETELIGKKIKANIWHYDLVKDKKEKIVSDIGDTRFFDFWHDDIIFNDNKIKALMIYETASRKKTQLLKLADCLGAAWAGGNFVVYRMLNGPSSYIFDYSKNKSIKMQNDKFIIWADLKDDNKAICLAIDSCNECKKCAKTVYLYRIYPDTGRTELIDKGNITWAVVYKGKIVMIKDSKVKVKS